MVAKAASLACFLMKERPGCSQRRILTFAQRLDRSLGGGHWGLGIQTVAELVGSNYFQMPMTPISNCSAYPGNINAPAFPGPPKVFTSKIDFLCHYVLPNFV